MIIIIISTTRVGEQGVLHGYVRRDGGRYGMVVYALMPVRDK